jgi:DNA-binding winged helix-turn-helix (wHTH) protein
MAVSADKIYEFGDWRLDPAEHLLLRNGSPVPLGPKVFDTLVVLVENAGRLVTKDEFMKRVWPDSFVEDLALTQNISQLRKILGNGEEPVIETVPKRGYRLLVPVRVRERTPSVEPATPGKPGPRAASL